MVCVFYIHVLSTQYCLYNLNIRVSEWGGGTIDEKRIDGTDGSWGVRACGEREIERRTSTQEKKGGTDSTEGGV